jgi:hypothetical protein
MTAVVMRNSVNLLLYILLFYLPVSAQDPSQRIFLRSGMIDSKATILTDIALSNPLFSRSIHNGQVYLLLQFKSLPSEQQKLILEKEGIDLLEYIPENTFLVRARASVPTARLRQLSVAGTIAIESSFKIEPVLEAEQHMASAQLIISAFPGITITTLVNELAKAGIVSTPWKNAIGAAVRCTVPAHQINDIASLPFVYYVEAYPGDLQPFNHESNILHGANVVNNNFGRNLTGKNVTVGIGDTGPFGHHADHFFKTIEPSGWDQNHSTHVAGIVAGSGLLDPRLKGRAPGTLLVGEMLDLILINTPLHFQRYKMLVTNNSYGRTASCRTHAFYNSDSRFVDQQLLDYPEVMHVFAAGNENGVTCVPYPVSYGTISGGYQSAKNSLCVGGSNKSDGANYYSKGPTRDGRIKPEITAIGRDVMSTAPYNTYRANFGTSMAAPQVTGVLALLIERYRQLNNGTNPSGALLKSIICNAAEDVGNSGPDFANGFGWLNALRAIEMIEDRSYHRASVTNGQQQTINVNATAGLHEMKFLLYWPDRPGSLFASRLLVNDLDISVTAPNGTVYKPLVLDSVGAGVLQTAVAGEDHANNIEQIIIRNPIPGNYTITVKGHSVPFGPQEFFVSYNLRNPAFHVGAPMKKDKWKGGERQLISWSDPSVITGSYKIEFSPDGGAAWQHVATTTGTAKHHAFVVPDIQSLNAAVRITNMQTSEQRVIDSIVIMPEINFALSSPCTGIIRVSRNAIAGIDSVSILVADGGAMKTLVSNNELTNYLWNMHTDLVYHISVMPWKNGTAGERAIAKSIQPTGGVCDLPEFDGDFQVVGFINPASGRLHSSLSRSPNEPVQVQLKNNDNDASTAPVRIKLFLNDVLLETDTIVTTIAGSSTYLHTFTSTIDLTNAGEYRLSVSAQKDDDLNGANNFYSQRIKVMANEPMNLPVEEDFEYIKDTIYSYPSYTGLDGAERWDFSTNHPTGKLRMQVNSNNRGFVPDKVNTLLLTTISNTITGTYNLRNYSLADNIFFSYSTQNALGTGTLYVRGSDTSKWLAASAYDPASKSGNLHRNITRLFRDSGQMFSSSFQVKFETQFTFNYDTVTGRYYDNIRLYKWDGDLALDMVNIVNPMTYHLTDTILLKVAAMSNTNSLTRNINIKASIRSGASVNYVLNELAAYDSLHLVIPFPVRLFGKTGVDTIFLRMEHPDDTYTSNNNAFYILNVVPVVDSFPFLDRLEDASFKWFAGSNSQISNHPSIENYPRKAANGERFWYMLRHDQTFGEPRLGNLVSPGIDISKLKNPYFSFSGMRHLRPGRDSAFFQISFNNGRTWQKLNSTQTTNWYNVNNSSWSDSDKVYWHVITTKLPDTNKRVIQLRMLVVRLDGLRLPVWIGSIGADDMHVYDLEYPIIDEDISSASGSTGNGAGWKNFIINNRIAGAVNSASDNQSVYWQFINTGKPTRIINGRKTLSRKWILKPNDGSRQAAKIRLYFTDEEAELLRSMNGCTNCSDTVSAYDFGIYQYHGPSALVNELRHDNIASNYSTLTSREFDLVPYDKGYYAEFTAIPEGEFYLYLPERYSTPVINWSVRKATGQANTSITWSSDNEQLVDHYEIERATGNDHFEKGLFEVIHTKAAGSKDYMFVDEYTNQASPLYYRHRTIFKNGYSMYTTDAVISRSTTSAIRVYPNPSDGRFNILLPTTNGNMVRWQLVNSLGQVLQTQNISGSNQVNNLVIDLRAKGYSAGVYLLKLEIEGETQIIKLIKH